MIFELDKLLDFAWPIQMWIIMGPGTGWVVKTWPREREIWFWDWQRWRGTGSHKAGAIGRTSWQIIGS